MAHVRLTGLMKSLPLPPLELAEASVRYCVLIQLKALEREADRCYDVNARAFVYHAYRTLIRLPDYWWKYAGTDATSCLLDITYGDRK